MTTMHDGNVKHAGKASIQRYHEAEVVANRQSVSREVVSQKLPLRRWQVRNCSDVNANINASSDANINININISRPDMIYCLRLQLTHLDSVVDRRSFA